ncbi:MAG: hypothetical protein KAH20_02215 [Methylococcales bacterium]|nr:hypothetical protein [Methylococcales bacterium]
MAQKIVLAMVIPIFLWFAYERFSIFVNSDTHFAVITSCEGKWTEVNTNNRPHSGVSTSSRRQVVLYVPVATSQDNLKGKGTFWTDNAFCQRMLGQKTHILVDKNDAKKGYIYNYIQFWFLPLFFLLFSILFISFDKSVLFNRLVFFVFVLVATFFILKEINLLSAVLKRIGITYSVEKTSQLERCINAALAKEGILDEGKIKELSCQAGGITDLTRVASLINLEKLFIQDNNLVSFDSIPLLTKLKVLHVSGSKTLTSLDGISKLVSLETLVANKCSIVDISDMEPLTEVTEVQFMMNKIKDISALSSLKKLKKIGLNYNEIADISSLNHLSKLEKVELSHNKISKVDSLSDKKKLRRLTLYSNTISSIKPLFSNTAMKKFGISGNKQVDCLEVAKIKNILVSNAKVWGPKKCD